MLLLTFSSNVINLKHCLDSSDKCEKKGDCKRFSVLQKDQRKVFCNFATENGSEKKKSQRYPEIVKCPKEIH